MFLKNKLNRIFFKFIIFLFIFGFLFIAVDFIVAKEIKILSNVGDIVNFRSKIGIGTSNPIHDLHIYNTSANAEIDIQSISGANNHWAIYNNASDNSLRFWNGNLSVDEKNIFVIDSRGNVGISTTQPLYKLDVNGTVNVSSRYNWNGSPGITFTYNNLVPTDYNIWYILTSISGVNTASSPTVITARNSINQLCYMYFTSGILTSSTCP